MVTATMSVFGSPSQDELKTSPARSSFQLSWEDILKNMNYVTFDKPPTIESPGLLRTSLFRQPPTQIFLDHQSQKDRDYTKQYCEVLPVEQIIQREADHLNTHVPLYTAFTKEIFLIHTFTKSLISMIPVEDEKTARNPKTITWMRNPLAKIPTKTLYSNVPDYLSMIQGDQMLDNTRTRSWELISCNPHLFGNVTEDAQESTVDFYWDNISVSPPPIDEIVNESLNNANLLKEKTQQRKEFINEMKDACKMIDGKRGVLYQLFIPHSEIKDSIYICGKNGKTDPAHTDAQSSLLAIQQDPSEIPNYKSMQVRLLAARWINPSLNADFQTFMYSDVPDATLKGFESRIDEIVNSKLG